MVRRGAPSWVATIFVVLLIVGYFVYSAARLRSATLDQAKVPSAASARP
jgi:hypothetical protein